MNRNKKNIIMGVLLVLLVASVFFTIGYAKNNISVNNTNQNMMEGTPPNMPNGENNMGEAPEKPNRENGEKPTGIPEMANGGNGNRQPMDMKTDNYSLSTVYYILFGVEGLAISLIVIYLIISKCNKKTIKEVFKTGDKITIFILSTVLLTCILTIGSVAITNHYVKSSNVNKEEISEKDKVDLNENNVISSGNIDLSKYETDITITESGTYTFTGNFKHSIIVNAKDQDVEILLNGVEIETESTATIIGLSAKTIAINTEEGTENKLTDGGNSEYDGCIFSNTELVFGGSGKLIVNGKQNEGEGIATEAQDITINSGTIIITSNDDGINAGGDGATITINGGNIYVDASGDGIDSNKDAVINGGTLFVMGSDIGGDAGIDTDAGFSINGGFVVALGSDMIETPTNSSKQTTIAFTLDEKIDKDTLVTLMKDEEVIVSFEAIKSFKTIIISNDTLIDGDYSLYKDGKNTGSLEYGIYQNGKYTKGSIIKVNNIDAFNVSKKVNLFGSGR